MPSQDPVADDPRDRSVEGPHPTDSADNPFATLTFSSNEAVAGTVIGPYHLVQPIGQGGMGEVWLAEQNQPVRRRVAVKLIKAGMDTREVVARFESERQALALMVHPAIAKVFDAGTTPQGQPYFVMEYVTGIPITAYCDMHKLSLRQRLELFVGVCEGVQHAHQKAVLHRDLKPSHILVSEIDGKLAPRIIDFGVAKATEQRLTADTMFTRVGAIGGTPGYLSPEQADSAGRDVDTRTDVYSLGVVLYELLVGVLPLDFSKTPLDEFQRRLREEDAPQPSTKLRMVGEQTVVTALNRGSDVPTLAHQLRGDVDAIVLKALEKERARRYASPSELAADIGRYLGNEPVLARPASAAYRARKYVRRHRVGVGVAASAAVLLVSVALAQTFELRRSERVRADRVGVELRKFARFVLFDFDDALRSGVTPARKLLVTEALGYLNRLAADTRGDLALEKEIIDGYLKVGDVEGNPNLPNLGDAAGAKQSYAKALEMAQAIRAKHPSDPDVQGLLATVEMKFGALVSRSDPVAALKPYKEAQSLLERLGSNDSKTKHSLTHVLLNIGIVQLQLGDTKSALGAFTRTQQIAHDLLAADGNDGDAREMMATADARSGDALAASGFTSEALEQYHKALAIYEEILSLNPQSSARHRTLAVLIAMGDAFTTCGKKEEAVDSDRRALQINETLLKEDPKNEQYRDDLTVTLPRLAEGLVAAKHMQEAWQVTDRALKVLRPMVDAPNASFDATYQFCWLLLTTPFKELQHPALAKQFAEKLSETTKANDPDTLDLLARAYFGTGDALRAVETEAKAISLLPANTQSTLRRELESNLTKFRSRAESKKPK